MQLAQSDIGVVLVSSDAHAASGHYCDVHGFRAGAAAALPDGTCRATVFAGRNRIDLLEPATCPPRHDGAIYACHGIRVLAIFVDDLTATCDRLRATGKRAAPARDLPGRLQITFAKDVDGNMLELIGLPSPPAAESDLTSRIQVGLTVRDVEASRRFYGEVLGFAEQPPLPMGRGITRYAFQAGRTTIKFWATDAPKPTRTGPPFDAVGLRMLRLPVEDPAAALAQLAARGALVVDAQPRLHTSEEDARYIADPDGNWIQLAAPSA